MVDAHPRRSDRQPLRSQLRRSVPRSSAKLRVGTAEPTTNAALVRRSSMKGHEASTLAVWLRLVPT